MDVEEEVNVIWKCLESRTAVHILSIQWPGYFIHACRISRAMLYKPRKPLWKVSLCYAWICCQTNFFLLASHWPIPWPSLSSLGHYSSPAWYVYLLTRFFYGNSLKLLVQRALFVILRRWLDKIIIKVKYTELQYVNLLNGVSQSWNVSPTILANKFFSLYMKKSMDERFLIWWYLPWFSMWKEPEVDPRDGHAIVRCKRRKRKKERGLVEGHLAAHVLHFAK